MPRIGWLGSPEDMEQADRAKLTLALIVGVGLGGLLFAPVPRAVQSPLGQSVMNSAHLPVFAVFVWVGRLMLRVWLKVVATKANVISFLLVVLAAFGVEAIQPMFGRSGSLEDAIIGLIGAALMFATPWCRSRGRKIAWCIAVVLGSLGVSFPVWRELHAIQHREAQFPILGDFERTETLSYWIPAGYLEPMPDLVSLSGTHAKSGAQSLHVKCIRGKWPGVFMAIGGQDWSGYEVLVMDLYNPGKPFELGVRLDDNHPDSEVWGFRYDGLFQPTNGWNHIEIPIRTIAKGGHRRSMNMNDIRRMILFVDWKQKPCEWYLDNVRLLPGASKSE